MAFPIQNGKYEVVPGLRKMNLEHEKTFWVTDEYEHEIATKWVYSTHRNPVHVAHDADKGVIDDILLEAGAQFRAENPRSTLKMGCRLGMQVQEDLAIVQETDDGNRVIYLHVSFPNGWDPAEKIGGSFASIHEPVAHFGRMSRQQDQIVRAMIDRGPFERHAWGIHTTDELDRLGRPDQWLGCDFKQAVFRTERQTTLGFPEYRAALFTIHTMITPFEELAYGQRLELAKAVESMDEEARAYKGLDVFTIARMTSWLRGLEG